MIYLEYSHRAICPICKGSGMSRSSISVCAKCSHCNGEGIIYYRYSSLTGSASIIYSKEQAAS